MEGYAPFELPPTYAAPPASREGVTRRPADILVVAGDLPLRRGLERSLGHAGHRVLSAGTLAEARAMLSAFVVDVVLCDLAPPDGGSGADLLAAWPADVPKVPTLALTSHAGARVVERCRAAGFADVIEQPVDLAALERALERSTR